MKKYFWPDWYFEDFSHIPKGFFKKNDIRYLICDIDNTLVTYDESVPNPAVKGFFKRLAEENVKLAFASNNDELRVLTFANDAGHPAVFNASKPFGRGVRKAMDRIKASSERCAMLGDQLLTDGLAARHVGMRMILVKPIKDKPSLLFRIKRFIEQRILKNYLRHFKINDPDPDSTDISAKNGNENIQ